MAIKLSAQILTWGARRPRKPDSRGGEGPHLNSHLLKNRKPADGPVLNEPEITLPGTLCAQLMHLFKGYFCAGLSFHI